MYSSDFRCRVCGHTKRRAVHSAREMMFGTRETFDYDECASCGSLQISTIPDADVLSRHYPENYYSFSERASRSRDASWAQRAYQWLSRERDKTSLRFPSLAGPVLNIFLPNLAFEAMRLAGITRDCKVLDVGCGSGIVLDRLAELGFRNLLGCDPFVPEEMVTRHNVRIQKKTLSDITGTFDLVMFHHSFEHVPDPSRELAEVARRLSPSGRCLVRIPTPSSELWERYGTDWAQLDAPRHLTLISRMGMDELASRHGLVVERVQDDSEAWSVEASELCRREVPFKGKDAGKAFSRREKREFKRRAISANARHKGDQASFILKHR